MRKVIIFLTIFLNIFLPHCSKQLLQNEKNWIEDIIYTEKGEEYKCRVTKITSDSIYIATADTELTFPQKEIRSIDLAQKREGHLWKKTTDITDPILLQSLKTDLSEFSDKKYVDIYCKRHLKIEKDSSYAYSIRCIRAICSEKGRNAGNINFNYLSREEKMEINFGRTITKEGEVLHLRENAIEDASIYSRIPPYENAHERKIALREVKPGNFLDFKVTIYGKISEESPFILETTLGNAGPTLKSIIRVEVPRNFDIAWQNWKIEEPELKFSGRNKILHWEIDLLEAFEDEDNAPPKPYVFPGITAGINSNWEKTYKNFNKHLEGEYTPQSSEPEKIYKEIINLIRFVDIPSHKAACSPKSVEEILENKLANSLDKAYLLYSALLSKEHPAELILVRSKTRGELAKDVPSLYQFDGALIRLGEILLDPSSELNPYGYIRPEYQGVSGLSVTKDEFVQIPLFEPGKEKTSISRIIELKESGEAKIEEKMKFLGSMAIGLKSLRYMREEDKKNMIESYLNRNIPGSNITDLSFNHIDNGKPEVQIDVRYTAKGLALKQGNFLLFHIPGIDYSAYSVGATERKYPIYWGKLGKEENEIKINIPEGYTVRYLPKEISLSNPFIEFKNTLIKDAKTITYTDYYIDKEELIPVAYYSEYKDIITQIAELSEEWIILEKKE
ncbi:DUF3857 domain-containing protein [candidate division WOR-3 bacterium]|nr:DUF3857 domain-containing protein [candidate division WOR-3 bacterium]